jgi:hypothetical protein
MHLARVKDALKNRRAQHAPLRLAAMLLDYLNAVECSILRMPLLLPEWKAK